jgi:hypothetical protein
MTSVFNGSGNFDTELTVVIATIGEDVLCDTVEALSRGSLVPRVMLLCIPREIKERVGYLATKYPFVEIVPTDVKGQVTQRIIGFRMSKTKYTLQLDSDVVVDPYLVENLKKSIKKNPGSCVGPAIYRDSTQGEYSFLSGTCNVFTQRQKKLITRVLNGAEGYQSGVISKGGIGFGPDPQEPYGLVEWLPGCCVMHETKSLIVENIYHRKGKAYAEDLFHSYYLRQCGVAMMHDSTSKLYVKFPEVSEYSALDLVKEQLYSFAAGMEFVNITKKSALRFSLYFGLKVLFVLVNRIFKR